MSSSWAEADPQASTIRANEQPRSSQPGKTGAAFAALLLLIISGIIPDIGFGYPDTFTGVTRNAYGTFASHVTAAGLGNFTGPRLVDMIEHVSLIVPGLAAVAGVLIFTAGEQVITVPAIRASVLWLNVGHRDLGPDHRRDRGLHHQGPHLPARRLTGAL